MKEKTLAILLILFIYGFTTIGIYKFFTWLI